MPRGRKTPLSTVDPITEGRADRALDLAVLLATLAEESDPRLLSSAGRISVATEAGLSEGEFRRRLSDARKLLSAQDSPEAQAIFGFGPRTVLIEGARYRTRKANANDLQPGRLYAILEGGEVVSTIAGDVIDAAPKGNAAFWHRVRALISQGVSSAQAIAMAAGESEERQYLEEVIQERTKELVELIGSVYPMVSVEGLDYATQSSFID